MAISIWEVSITEAPLMVPAQDHDGSAGAVVDFLGIVREKEENRVIEGIEYEAHQPMAEHQLTKIAKRAAADFSLLKIILIHRIGFVKVSEPSLFLRVASSHRPAAFAASQWIIDELKRSVPIWKRPIFVISPYAGETMPDSPREGVLRS